MYVKNKITEWVISTKFSHTEGYEAALLSSLISKKSQFHPNEQWSSFMQNHQVLAPAIAVKYFI